MRVWARDGRTLRWNGIHSLLFRSDLEVILNVWEMRRYVCQRNSVALYEGAVQDFLKPDTLMRINELMESTVLFVLKEQDFYF